MDRGQRPRDLIPDMEELRSSITSRQEATRIPTALGTVTGPLDQPLTGIGGLGYHTILDRVTVWSVITHTTMTPPRTSQSWWTKRASATTLPTLAIPKAQEGAWEAVATRRCLMPASQGDHVPPAMKFGGMPTSTIQVLVPRPRRDTILIDDCQCDVVLPGGRVNPSPWQVQVRRSECTECVPCGLPGEDLK